MKTIQFTYTKVNGEVSQRVLQVKQEPTKNIGGVDITKLNAVERKFYAANLKLIHDEYMYALKELNSEFEVDNNYRQFKPELMTDIKVL